MGSTAVIAAVVFAGLGGRSSLAGLAGKDDYGAFMLKGLRGFGIDTGLVRRTKKVHTGVTVNLIHSGQRTQVTYPGTIAAYDGTGLTREALRRFRHIHFAGPYLQTNLRPRITDLLRSARSLGLTTSLDPQWDMTGKWAFMDEWLPLLDFFFPNHDEALSITDAASAAQSLRALAARTACPVVKLGAKGALLLQSGRVLQVPAPVVKVVDTTGAGDSFDAGFLYATLVRKMDRPEAVRFANAVAARSCTFVGGVNARTTYADALQSQGTQGWQVGLRKQPRSVSGCGCPR
jgi:sugar/nucleoside kinase (ribokinase family)